MIRNMLTASVAAAAIAVAAPALAHPGGGGGAGGPGGGAGAMGHMGGAGGLGAGAMGGPGGFGGAASMEAHGGGGMASPSIQMGGPSQTGIDARAGSMGPANASPTGIEHASPNSVLNNATTGGSTTGGMTERQLRQSGGTSTTTTDRQLQREVRQATRAANSQAFLHASPIGIEHASPNSVLGRAGIPSGMLTGLTTGLTVQSSGGTQLGTVSQVLTTRNGSIAGVIVTTPTGQSYRLPASALSVSGSTVTANTSELFEGSGVPSALLPGLATGLTVDTTGGTTLGTISQIDTGRNGTITSVVVTGTNGQTYTLPASSLSIANGTVSVNTAEAFEGTSVPSSLLPGLTSGLTVDTSTGTSLGTISQVNTGANGSISSVVVTTSSGQTYTIPASSLSIANGTVSVNTAEAFESTGVPGALLPGLTTGLTVDSTSGTSIGTIANVISGSNGTIQDVVVMGTNGQTYVVPASSLSISGDTVTVASLGFDE